MASALHPQTLLTFKISDEVPAPKYGYPLKLRIPTKLGFKNPKWITAMYVTNRFPGGFWEDRGYNWFGGVRFTRLRCSVERRNTFGTVGARGKSVDVEPHGRLMVSRCRRGRRGSWHRSRRDRAGGRERNDLGLNSRLVAVRHSVEILGRARLIWAVNIFIWSNAPRRGVRERKNAKICRPPGIMTKLDFVFTRPSSPEDMGRKIGPR